MPNMVGGQVRSGTGRVLASMMVNMIVRIDERRRTASSSEIKIGIELSSSSRIAMR